MIQRGVLRVSTLKRNQLDRFVLEFASRFQFPWGECASKSESYLRVSYMFYLIIVFLIESSPSHLRTCSVVRMRNYKRWSSPLFFCPEN